MEAGPIGQYAVTKERDVPELVHIGKSIIL